MKHLKAINKYFWKYRYRFLTGIFFTVASNYFAVLAPEMTGYVVDKVQQHLSATHAPVPKHYDSFVMTLLGKVEKLNFTQLVIACSVIILVVAVIRGILMFFMRQTLIVMSRHIEYDQKNEVYAHYQQLDAAFYKTHSTGDLMNRIAEDVSRVRMYTGPAIMYFINLVALIAFSIINMWRKDVYLTVIVLAPLPILALTIYIANSIIHRKSERVQALLSDLTTNAQESYSGIRVIKSFVQEKAMLGFFKKNSEEYRKNAIGLAKTEAIYFPSMTLMIGLSTLLTIFIGGGQVLKGQLNTGVIVEFVIYINMLTFPVSAIGWVASMTQRASASQKRLNEFLKTEPAIQNPADPIVKQGPLTGDIVFKNISFTYAHTGIKALDNFSLTIKQGQKVLILGKTGSGKSTIGQLLLRFYDADEGAITIGGKEIQRIPLQLLRNNISYVPQDVFLFSDTIANNINFGLQVKAPLENVKQAAANASIDAEIESLPAGYETAVGERGVTLSGGQKQRVSIARALIKQPQVMLFDDCLSAVDTKTENRIITSLQSLLKDKTAILITHRIFTVLNFDQVIIIEDGRIIEQGTHDELIMLDGYYADLYRLQSETPENEPAG
ncbi:MAG TPA: ABC transporter ATP-binding protein [Chitinophagaceae bacterium]|nr:ABC transporter ATP-binding protein [Chitinophagaceae bacterium]